MYHLDIQQCLNVQGGLFRQPTPPSEISSPTPSIAGYGYYGGLIGCFLGHVAGYATMNNQLHPALHVATNAAIGWLAGSTLGTAIGIQAYMMS